MPTLCHILKVSSHLLMAHKATPTSTSDPQPTTSLTKQQSPERVSAQGGQGSSGCEYHGAGRTPGHESRTKRKVSRVVSNYQLSPTGAGQPQPAHVLREHGLVAQVVLSIVGARLPTQVRKHLGYISYDAQTVAMTTDPTKLIEQYLTQTTCLPVSFTACKLLQELSLFTVMVREAFSGGGQRIVVQPHLAARLSSERSSTLANTASSASRMSGRWAPQQDVSELLQEEACKAGLVPSFSWLYKVEQLYTLTQIKHGES